VLLVGVSLRNRLGLIGGGELRSTTQKDWLLRPAGREQYAEEI
jgi:hypothetical protein